jgi:hypothetical protein
VYGDETGTAEGRRRGRVACTEVTLTVLITGAARKRRSGFARRKTIEVWIVTVSSFASMSILAWGPRQQRKSATEDTWSSSVVTSAVRRGRIAEVFTGRIEIADGSREV